MTVTNTGSVAGDEVARLYLHDPVASLSQPVRRLVGFERVTLAPGQSKVVRFTLDRGAFGFHDNDGRLVVEPGTIEPLRRRLLQGRQEGDVHGHPLTRHPGWVVTGSRR